MLIPRASPVTGIPGWQVITASRRLAVAVAAIAGGTVSGGKGEWRARIPGREIPAIVTGADSVALWCHAGAGPDAGPLALAFAPWPASAVLRCAPADLPAAGRLSVRDVRVTTRMGRTVRYLVPEFIPQEGGAHTRG